MYGLECLRNVLRSGFHKTGTIPKMSKSKKGEKSPPQLPAEKYFNRWLE